MRMNKTGTMIVALAIGFGLANFHARADHESLPAAANKGQLTDKDYKFVQEAARGGQMEVELGELARQRGASQTVRDFGDRMVKDHSKAGDELKQIIARKGASIPTSMSHQERSTMDSLQKATGKDFDKAYAKDMLKDHKEDVKKFQAAAKELNDPDLRAFAQKTLPTLEQHLQLAEQMEKAVK